MSKTDNNNTGESIEQVSAIQQSNENQIENENDLKNEEEETNEKNQEIIDPNDQSYNSEEDPVDVIIFDSELHFLPKIYQVEIVFVLDTTKSMNPYLKGVKRFIRKLIFDAKKTLSHYENVELDVLKLGLVGYKDHDQANDENSYVSKVLCELTDDQKKFKKALFNVTADGGDDDCEAVADGLNEIVKNIKWGEDSLKYVYHICDSPCHGTQYCKDKNPKKKNGVLDHYDKGCPCELDIKNILKTMRGKYIEYTIVIIDSCIEKMISEFSKFVKIDVMTPGIEKEEGVPDNQRGKEEGEEEE